MTARHRDVIAVGASAGGVESLRALVSGLPADFPGSILVVLHLPRDAPTALARILGRSGPLPATTARDGEEARPGRIFIAPNDHHLLLIDGHLRLSHGPAENGHRPAIDPLFRSVARAAGPRGIGVVLSGSRDDGAAGLAGILAHGGAAVVQDPEEALYSAMPRAALAQAPTEHVATAAKLGGLLVKLTARPLPAGPAPPAGRLPDPFTLAEQVLALEGALWMALRALEEKAELSRRMAESSTHRRAGTGQRFDSIAVDADAAGAMIRQLIARLAAPPPPAADTTGPARERESLPSDVR